jgi:hypothetical protein
LDGNRFDALSISLGHVGTRRGALATLFAGAFGFLGRVDAGAKKGGGKKGKGKSGKKKGKKANRTVPPPPCQGQPNDTPCEGSGRCLAGICNPAPVCPVICAGRPCCGTCNGPPEECVPSAPAGSPCLSGGDCVSGRCVGYRCLDTGCIYNQDYCANGTSTCHGSGLCLMPIGETAALCGYPAPSGICGCRSKQDCAVHGPTAFCALDNGSSSPCPCTAPNSSFCALPR